jgi:hypothetical protein
MRYTIPILLLFLIPKLSLGQLYNKEIEYSVNGSYYPKIPIGYAFVLKGRVDPSIRRVDFLINGEEAGSWTRVDNSEKEFRLKTTTALVKGDVIKVRFTNESNINEASDSAKDANKNRLLFKLFTDTPSDSVEGNDQSPSRFSPFIGVGGAFLGRGESKGNDIIGYTAIKFRLTDKVDKTLRFSNDSRIKVYPRIKDQFSIFFGGIVSQVAYKGTLLANPVFSMKPMLGFSFDMTPDISIDAGAFLFDYHPYDQGLKPGYYAKSGIGLFLGISLDADAFNRLSAAFNNKSYNPTK